MKVVSRSSITGELTEVDVQEGSTAVLTGLTCDSDVFVGAVVRLDRTGPADITMDDWTSLIGLVDLEPITYTVQVKNALADSLANARPMGIVYAKSSATVCDISLLGLSPSLYFSLDVLDEYYLSDVYPGTFVKEAMAPSDVGTVKIKIGMAVAEDRLVFQPGHAVVN